MGCSYRILGEAQAEIENIVVYLLSIADGTSAAASFVAEFEHQVDLVCENPQMYNLSHIAGLARLGYRVMLVGNYIALYFFRNNTVFIAHVFHQSQDYASLV